MNGLGWTVVIVLAVVVAILIFWLACSCPGVWKLFTSTLPPVDQHDNDVKLENLPVVPLTSEQVNTQILSFQDKLRADENQHETIKKVQALLLALGTHVDEEYEFENMHQGLIIGVDATPATQAGYCLNLFDKTLCFYVIKRDDLPWTLNDAKDTSEFEMKNLMFALTVWKNQILWFRRFCIFTDNYAICRQSTLKYGERAKQYLQHFVNCERVTIINQRRMAVNKFKELKTFAKYIQPADDLSRWKINSGLDFLTRFYGIQKENVKGTHDLKIPKPSSKPRYEPNAYYKKILEAVSSSLLILHF